MEVKPIFKFLHKKPKVLLALAQMLSTWVFQPKSFLMGVCGLKCVAVELVGELQNLRGSGDRQCGVLLWTKGHVPALLPLSKLLEVLLQLLMVFQCLYHIVYCSVISKQLGW